MPLKKLLVYHFSQPTIISPWKIPSECPPSSTDHVSLVWFLVGLLPGLFCNHGERFLEICIMHCQWVTYVPASCIPTSWRPAGQLWLYPRGGRQRCQRSHQSSPQQSRTTNSKTSLHFDSSHFVNPLSGKEYIIMRPQSNPLESHPTNLKSSSLEIYGTTN